MEFYSGVYTVIPTFFKDTEIDLEQLKSNINHQINCGIKNIVILGTTSETPTLSEYEENLIVETTWENYNEKVKDSNEKIDDEVISEKKNKKLVEQDESELFEDNNFLQSSSFTEIVPLNLNIDNENRKELTSIPIDEIDFPNIVFMIIDKNTELEIKQLKDYPEWDFLPEDDLRYKTIEIYSDLKDAKRNCRKDQKVMKVSNPNVFKVAAKMMLAKGISRIISDKLLIAL